MKTNEMQHALLLPLWQQSAYIHRMYKQGLRWGFVSDQALPEEFLFVKGTFRDLTTELNVYRAQRDSYYPIGNRYKELNIYDGWYTFVEVDPDFCEIMFAPGAIEEWELRKGKNRDRRLRNKIKNRPTCIVHESLEAYAEALNMSKAA